MRFFFNMTFVYFLAGLISHCAPPADLPEQLASNIDPASWRGIEDRQDVVVLVKRFISDPALSQKPLLVLPFTRVHCVNLYPCDKQLGSIKVESHM